MFFFKNDKLKLKISINVFCGFLLSGIVLITISSSFAYMLSEQGLSATVISAILLATLPYSWKFLMSPIIKKLICNNEKKDIAKIILYISQTLIFFSLVFLGIFEKFHSIIIASLLIFIITIAISVHDIIYSHIKLSCFEQNELGIITSISNAGFRLGMFFAGTGVLFLANFYNWKISFLVISLFSFLPAITTFLSNKIPIPEKSNENEKFTQYLKSCSSFFKVYGVVAFFIFIFAFKFSDSAINSLKPIFLQSMGISKIAFANISHTFGLVVTVISGIFAGIASYKIGSLSCLKISLYGQIFASLIFFLIAFLKFDLISITILVNISSFIFGFSTVAIRTFMAEISNKDVNLYMVFLSIGSILRISSGYLGGCMADLFSWQILYITSAILNIPAIIILLTKFKQPLSALDKQ